MQNIVANRPKILQNNSKPAPEKKVGREKLAAVQPPFVAKTGRKKYLMKNMYFP
jgi:hypothetical protein